MRKALSRSLWVFLVVAAVAVPSAAQGAPPRNTITVTGEAILQVAPDRATVTLGVITQQTTASEAMREVSHLTRRILEEEVHRLRALQAAVHNARQRAEALAKAAGISGPLRVVQITESSAAVTPRLAVSASMRAVEAEAVPVEAGLVMVSATVTVVFEF